MALIVITSIRCLLRWGFVCMLLGAFNRLSSYVAKPHGYDIENNAIRAVARLTNAAAMPKEAPWALGTLGPNRGLEVLARDLQFVRADQWVERAVQDVIARSAPGTISSAKSALRVWAAFADQSLDANGRRLPPSEEGLVAWSQCFHRAHTFSNYVSYLRLGCDILGVSSAGMDGPLLKRQKKWSQKKGNGT